MSSWTIGRKITVTCAALIVLVVALGGTAFYSVSSLKSELDVILSDSLPGVTTLGGIDTLTAEMRGDMLAYIESRSEEDRSRFQSDLSDKHRACTESLQKHSGAAMSGQERQLFDRIGPSLERVMEQWRKVEALGRAGKVQEASAAFASSVDPVYGEMMKLVDEALRTSQANAAKEGEAAQQTGERSHFAVVLILALSVLGGSALAFFIVRGANRDLRQMVGELSEGAEQVAAASLQVSASSQSLAQGASEQAASIEETSASTEEINSMTRKNAENSRSAAGYMTETAQRVSEANRTLQQMVVSMKDITASSDKISKIIKVIDEIAFQTNILALNAAVEAARAGEAGMGFAVVADEVRNLAQRSAQAAKDTASMIEESISKSSEGSAKLNQVAEAIGAITDSSNKVKTLVDEVNLGSQEQARGLDQISQAVAQMEQVTQKTAANAEEGASASEELNAQAEAMRAVVLRLRTMVDGSGAEGNRSLPARKAVPTHPKPHPASKGLAALKNAISAHQTTETAKPAIPLEAEFKDF